MFNESKPGVVIAKMKSMEDKKKVLTKAFLRDNRRYQNVYIYSDQRREERLMSANFRALISAFKSGVRRMRIISDQNRPDFESMEDDQLRPIYQQSRRNICVRYLPALNLSRQVDAQTFFDCLLTYMNFTTMDKYLCGSLTAEVAICSILYKM